MSTLKTTFILGVLVTFWTQILIAAEPAADSNQTMKLDYIEAVVNGKTITTRDLMLYANTARPAILAKTREPTRDNLIEEIISRELIYQDALSTGLDKNPEVQAEIENMRRTILANSRTQVIYKVKSPSQEQIQKAYENTADDTKTLYKLRAIIVDKEKEANDIIGQLNKGGDFIQLANEKSTKNSNKNGGDLGWVRGDMLLPQIKSSISHLDKGSYDKKAIQISEGWLIVKLEDKHYTTFEEAKESIRVNLEQEALNLHIEALKKKAKIDIKPAQGNK